MLYARFLKQIVNNDQEAVQQYERAMHIYTRFITSKGRGGLIDGGQSSSDNTELLMFGENSASAVVVMSLEAEKVGYMLHTNDEIYRLLGYERKNLIGKKVNMLQPRMIADIHDQFLKKFLETAKRSVLNHTLQLFAITASGYVSPISLLIKLYPQMSDKITIVGFIQILKKMGGFDMPKLAGASESQIEALTHHYIVTDKKGNIDSVSESLAKETGLHSQYFKSSDNFRGTLNIEDLFNTDLMYYEA